MAEFEDAFCADEESLAGALDENAVRDIGTVLEPATRVCAGLREEIAVEGRESKSPPVGVLGQQEAHGSMAESTSPVVEDDGWTHF